MQEWLRVCLILCAFGYFKEFRPSEPFVVDYLTGPHRNVSAEDIYQVLYPISTYSYLAHVVLTFLITDFFCYKPLIVLCGVSGIACWSLFVGFSNYASLIGAHVLFGTFLAMEIAYYTYIYAKVDKEHYQKVTSYTRAATLAGYFSGSVVGQVLMFTEVMDSKELTYVTVGALVTATICSFFLPSVSKSLYFHRSTKYNTFDTRRTSTTYNIETVSPSLQRIDIKDSVDKSTFMEKITDGVRLLWSHFVSAFSKKEVVHWSLWYALAMGGFSQVRYYGQVLWQDIEPNLDQTAIWNGAVEAALTIFGAAAALLAGYVKIGALHFGLLTLTICSLLTGGGIILAGQTSCLWVSYAAYIFAGIVYNFMITYSSYEIAKHLIEDSFGLVFGINTLVALIIQSVLTIVVNSEEGLALPPRSQFAVYGGYFIVLGVIFVIAALVSYLTRHKNNKST